MAASEVDQSFLGAGQAVGATAQDPAQSGGVSSARTSFDGDRREFAKLLLKGSALLIPTLGFYRFWLITDIRRHLWANTRIGDDSFEYTGTAKELLVGFLIALAVLAPIYIAYFILGLVAEQFKAFASVPLFAFFYVFGRYALYRARRYRASRTVFRGVRFWIAGSAWAYAGRALLWDLATVLSLGLLLPWRMAALERYVMRNTRFGDLAGDFEGSGGTLFRRGWWLWAAALAIIFIIVKFPAGGFSFVLLLALPGIIAAFLGLLWKWQVNAVRFGPISLSSNLNVGEVFGCYFGMLIAMFVYALLGGGLMAAVVYAAGRGLTTLSTGGRWDTASLLAAGVSGLTYLVLLIGFGAIKRYFVDRGVWQVVASSTTVLNVVALDHVVAAGDAASPVGEGFADALSIGGF